MLSKYCLCYETSIERRSDTDCIDVTSLVQRLHRTVLVTNDLLPGIVKWDLLHTHNQTSHTQSDCSCSNYPRLRRFKPVKEGYLSSSLRLYGYIHIYWLVRPFASPFRGGLPPSAARASSRPYFRDIHLFRPFIAFTLIYEINEAGGCSKWNIVSNLLVFIRVVVGMSMHYLPQT